MLRASQAAAVLVGVVHGLVAPRGTSPIFDGLLDGVAGAELQRWCAVDIGRRRQELVALAWLGRARRVLPGLLDESIFRFERYAEPWLADGASVAYCALKCGTAIVPRGIPVSLRLQVSPGGGDVVGATVLAVGCDLVPESRGAPLDDAAADGLLRVVNGRARALVADAIVSTVFETLEPSLERAKGRRLVPLAAPRTFTPRHDLFAREGTSEKWLQRCSDYYFADALLQEVAYEGDADCRFLFYADPLEPPNSANPTRNVNPEVICCKFAG